MIRRRTIPILQRIVLFQPVNDALAEMVASLLPSGFEAVAITSTDTAHLCDMAGQADYGVWWDVTIPAEVLRAAGRLKLMHKWGVGIDNIDLAAARAMGIQVARTTGSNAAPVADFAIGLMIALARRIPQAYVSTRAGGWEKNAIWRSSVMASGKVVGIVGLGAIGRKVARRLSGFDGRVLYHNRHRLDPAEEAALGVEYRSLGDLLSQSDVVMLHCPLTPETQGMIGRTELAAMKRSGLLINLARGGVVKEADLISALQAGEIAGAATDVFEKEPPDSDNELLHMGNVIVTPHCGAVAFDNSANGIRHWLRNIRLVADGQPIPERDRVV